MFTGPSQSGKTTAADMLTSVLIKLGHWTRLESFEAPVKYYLAELLDWNDSPIDTPIPELLNKTPRMFIQSQSQHMRFAYGPGVLGRLLRARVSMRTDKPLHVVIDDGSNINDVRELEPHYLISIERDRIERVYPFTIPNPDHRIVNSKDLVWLKQQIEIVANKILAL